MSRLLNYIQENEEAFKSRGRLSSLYSDFRIQQATNPDGYQANLSAWRKALIDATRAGLIPSQTGANNLLTLGTGDQLLRELSTKEWGQPLALAAVIQDAVARKELIPLKDFMTAKTSIYSWNWGSIPWSVLSWGLHQLGVLGNGSPDRLVSGEFVVMANLEAAANAILSQTNSAKSPIDLIYNLETFTSTYSHALSLSHALTSTDLSILLTHLSRDKAALSCDPDTQTIKLKPASAAHPTPITQHDITIAHLRSLIANLSTQLPALTARISECDAAARSAVAAKSTAAARAALRSKKLAESALTRRADTLAQLETVFARIEEAADQVEVVRAMESSASVLKSLNAQVGGAEGVEQVVERLRDEMGQVDEVSAIVGEVGREGPAGAVVDEEDVEAEFAELERVERERKEAEEAERTRRQASQDKTRNEQQTQAEEQEVLQASQELGRMSLDEQRPTDLSGEQEKEKERRREAPLQAK
ncbi:Snf7-domain-containing protein [Phyllosticta citriasiana]|uniref:Snf7-domain-containing protein n=1 Tax=Phyllosticta citriasiana TaxID=595635 RepID=A0ABR1KCS6_9PEZI